jgi:hypothetical protein
VWWSLSLADTTCPWRRERALALGCLGLVSFAVMALGGVWFEAKTERAAVQVSQARSGRRAAGP